MRRHAVILALFMVVSLALPGATAIRKDRDFNVEVLPGSSQLIPWEERWGTGVNIELKLDDDDVR